MNVLRRRHLPKHPTRPQRPFYLRPATPALHHFREDVLVRRGWAVRNVPDS